MKHLIAFYTLLFLSLYSIAQLSADDEKAIRKIMSAQEQCWNNADLECFMSGYWQSDSLKFIGKNGLTFGWQQTLDNYKKSYPTAEKMGKLSFEIISIESLGKEHVLLIGKWRLDRAEDVLHGHYSLTWKKINSEWKIIADHSS